MNLGAGEIDDRRGSASLGFHSLDCAVNCKLHDLAGDDDFDLACPALVDLNAEGSDPAVVVKDHVIRNDGYAHPSTQPFPYPFPGLTFVTAWSLFQLTQVKRPLRRPTFSTALYRRRLAASANYPTSGAPLRHARQIAAAYPFCSRRPVTICATGSASEKWEYNPLKRAVGTFRVHPRTGVGVGR